MLQHLTAQCRYEVSDLCIIELNPCSKYLRVAVKHNANLPGYPKIANFNNFTLCQEDVLCLEVAMHNVLLVHILKTGIS